jgi:uncharacterized protein (TIGR02466 family)
MIYRYGSGRETALAHHKDMREIQLIYNGPILFKTQISEEDIKKIKKLCSKNKKLDMRHNLAGIIDNEYQITDHETIASILTPYFEDFKQGYRSWYAKDITKIELVSCWVNYMVAGECNPLHTHNSCDFSSVLYLDIPKNLKLESKKSINNGSKPGDINFHFCNKIPHYIHQVSVLPEVGDFYMFPAMLPHSVNSFKSKGERISVACNFKIYD